MLHGAKWWQEHMLAGWPKQCHMWLLDWGQHLTNKHLQSLRIVRPLPLHLVNTALSILLYSNLWLAALL